MKRLSFALLAILLSLYSFSQDFSNKGKDFWVGYGYHVRYVTGNPINGQEMVLYFATDAITTVTVSIPGVGYSQTYSNIPANTIFETPAIPKTGVQDARLPSEGLFSRGIHITSDKPIVAYAHIYNASVSGATLLFPTNTLGKEYFSINYTQKSNENSSNGFFFVVAADTGTTSVEITPSAATLTHAAGVPFIVTLTQGQIYNVMGTVNGQTGVDLTGSKIRSISVGSGCKKIAVFSGSGKIYINCATNQASSADNLIAQVFPKSAWGKRFLTVPTANMPYNYFRVAVSDPTAIVKYNGVTLAGLINSFYYDIPLTNSPALIESDKPIMVAQYMTTAGSNVPATCGNKHPSNSGWGDPEMIYLSPIEQTIDKVILNSTPHFAIAQHWINVVIRSNAVASVRLDGVVLGAVFNTHPLDPSYSYAQINVTTGQHTLLADSGFNAIAYGYGPAESYGYNAGTNIRDLFNFVTPINPLSITNTPSTCSGTPFYFSITYPFEPTSLFWDFHGFQTPNYTVPNPPVADTTYIVNGKQIWRYRLPYTHTYSPAGNYPVSITAGTSGSDGCGNIQTRDDTLYAFDPPFAKIGVIHNGCVTDSVAFPDSTTYVQGTSSYKWWWEFGDGTFDSVHNPKHKYAAPGTYAVRFALVSNVGCLSDTGTRQVIITLVPQAKFGLSNPICTGLPITLSDTSIAFAPDSLVRWYWDYGDGTKDTLNTNGDRIHAFSPYGNKTVTLKVETNSGCVSNLFSKTFYVNPISVANFVMPPGICLPADSAHFFDASTIADGTQSGFGYVWDFGDLPSGSNNISTLKDPVHFYNNAGPFNIRLTVTSAAGCVKDTVKMLSTVYPQPLSNFSVAPETCLNDTTFFTDQSNALTGNTITNWYWNFGDGQTSSQQNPYHIYLSSGSYTATLYIKTDKGCFSDTIRKQLVINPLPTPKFGFTSPDCVTRNITFSDSSIANMGNITLWKWDMGDGTLLNLNNNSSFTYAYATSGTFIVTLSVQTDKGCKSAVFSRQIVINPLPVVDFSMTSVCLPDGISQFTDLSTIADGSQAAFTYAWDFGDPGSGALNLSTLKNPQHRYSSVGPFSIMLTVTSNNGCVKDSTKQLTQVYAQPIAGFSVLPENCLNDTTYFTDQSNPLAGNTITNWFWNFGDGQTSNTQNPSHKYALAGTYSVTLYITTDKSCNSDTLIKQVVINPLPTASFTFSAPTCETKSVTFTSTAVANAGNLTLWKWDMGDGTLLNRITGAAFTHIYASAQTYTVTLGVETNKGCKSGVYTVTVVVHAQPAPNFILPGVCLSDAFAVFNDSSYITDGTDSFFTYQWNFGDPTSGPLNISTLKNPLHKYLAAGIYSVTLTVTSNNGCTATIVKLLTVNGVIPKSDFLILSPTALCSNTNAQIRDSSKVLDFGGLTRLEIYWDFVNNPTVFDVFINPTPFTVYSHLYPNFQSPLVKNFNIRLRAFSGGTCVDEKTQTAIVNATPRVQFNNIPDTCLLVTPFQVTQASEVGGVPGTGVFSGTGINAAGIFDPAVAGVGSHLIRYTFTSNKGCIDFQEKTINILPPPTAKFGFSPIRCEGQAVTFSDSSTAAVGSLTTWTWDFGDGTPVVIRNNSAAFIHIFATAGTYQVKLTVKTNNGCNSSQYSFGVIVFPRPVPDFTMPKVCLPNANATFINRSTIADGTQSQFGYLWDFGDPGSGAANTSTGKDPGHLYSAVGPYSVRLTVTSGNGCIKDTVNVYNDIHPQPSALFTSNVPGVCTGVGISFTDQSDPKDGTTTEWHWDFGDGGTDITRNPTHSFSVAGTPGVKLYIVNSQGCTSNVFTLPVTIYAYPVVNAGPDRNVLENGTIILDPIVTGNGLSYLWTPPDYLTGANTKNPTVTGIEDRLYTLLVTATGGCVASDQMKVTVLKFPKIPNTFTPNSDGINDYWVIQNLETYPDCRVQVFTRYGQLVFESKGYSTPWNGTMKGKSLPFGTYYYVIEPGSGRKPVTGYVTLIK